MAIGLGTIKHPELAITENGWYTSVPTVLPNTKPESDQLNGFTELTSSGKFSSAKGGENIFVNLIVNGYTEEGMSDAEETAQTVTSAWKGKQYLALKSRAWQRLQEYYADLNK